METEQNQMEELSRAIRKLIEENSNFLTKVMDEDFEADETELDEEPPEIEL